MDRENVIAMVQHTATGNGGKPLGEKTFYTQTGLTEAALLRAGFPGYGTAVEAAGYQRNTFQQAYSDDQMFEPLAKLTRQLARFPKRRERQVERRQNSFFPGEASCSRRAKQEPLEIALLNWCRSQESFNDVAEILESAISTPANLEGVPKHPRKVVNGYVYLMRYGAHGKDFKIGFTDNVARREAQIDMMSPSDVRVVWKIETDDPKGIEEYWHKRFKDRRVAAKEIFRLTAEDIAAFKRRKYQ